MSNKRTKHNKGRSAKLQDNFASGDSLQPALQKPGAGYDDTGLGNDAEASRNDKRSEPKRSKVNKKA